MTVARYFMPSGRLIQTPYENGELEAYYKEKFSKYEEAILHPQTYLDEMPDSLKYQTLHGRTVFGGGGVMPDVVIPPDSTLPLNSTIVQTMLRSGTPFLFVRDRIDSDHSFRDMWKDRPDAFVADYAVPASFWSDFLAYARDNDYSFDAASADAANMTFTAEDLAAAKPTLQLILKARIAQRLFRAEAWYPVFNQIDPVVRASLGLWTNAETLAAYHEADGSGSSVRGGE
jgi:carboxyl-terminal processing protease